MFKNKKGFTLTELIAVIVIIGIVGSLLIVGVSRYINSARESTYNSYIETMKKAAENMIIECASGKNNCYDEIPNKGETNKIDYDEELVGKGYAEKLKDPEKDGDFCGGYVEVENNSENNNDVSKLSYKACLKCSGKEKGKNSECNETEETTYALCDEGDNKETCCNKFNNSLSSDSVVAENNWVRGERVIKFGCVDGKNCKYQKVFTADDSRVDKDSIEMSNGQSCDVRINIDNKKPECEIVAADTVSSPVSGWYTDNNVKMQLNLEVNGNEGKNFDSPSSYGISTSTKKEYNGREEIELSNGITTVFGYVKDSLGNEGVCYKEVKVNTSAVEQDIAVGYQIYPEEKNNPSDMGYGISIGNLSKYEEVKGIVIYFKENIVNKQTNIGYKLGDETTNLDYNINGKEFSSILSTKQKVDSINILSSDIKEKIDKIYLIVDDTDLDLYTNKDMLIYSFASEKVVGVEEYSFDNGEFSSKPYALIGDNKANIVVKAKTALGTVSSSKISITRIDKEAPSMPTVTLYKWSDNDTQPKASQRDSLSTYTAGTWSNKNLAIVAEGSRDNLSGIDGNYKFETTGADNRSKTVSAGGFIYITQNGETTLKYKVCDKAGNCATTQNYVVKVDVDGLNVIIAGYERASDGKATGDYINIGGYDSGGSYSSATYKEGTFTNKNIVTGWYPYDITFEVYMKPVSPIVKVETRISSTGYSTYAEATSHLPDSWTDVTGNLNANQKAGTEAQYYGMTGNGSRIRNIRITNSAGTVKTINITGNVDKTKPDVEVSVYKADSNGNKTGSALTVINDVDGEKSTFFENTDVRAKRTNSNWFNYAIVYEVSASSSYSKIAKIYNKTGADTSSYTESRGNVASSYSLDKEFNSKDITRSYAIGSSGNGVITKYVKVVNEAGKERVIILEGAVDKEAPKCSITKTSTGTSGVDVNIGCSDTHSHCKTGTQTGTKLKANKSYTIEDNAGNSNTCNVNVSSYDCNCNTSGYYTAWVDNGYFTINVSDTGTCVSQYTYSTDTYKQACTSYSLNPTKQCWCNAASRSYISNTSCDTCYK